MTARFSGKSGNNPVVDMQQFRERGASQSAAPIVTGRKSPLGVATRRFAGTGAPPCDDEVLYHTICKLFHRQGLMADMTRGAVNQGRIDFYLLGCPGRRIALMTVGCPWKIMPEYQDAQGGWHADLTQRLGVRDVVERRVNFGHDLDDPVQSAWNALGHALEDVQKNDGSFFLILQDPQVSAPDQILLFDGVAFDAQPRRLRLCQDDEQGAMVVLEVALETIDPFENRDHPAWQQIGQASAGVLAAAEAYAPGRLYEFLTRPAPVTSHTGPESIW